MSNSADTPDGENVEREKDGEMRTEGLEINENHDEKNFGETTKILPGEDESENEIPAINAKDVPDENVPTENPPVKTKEP